MDPNTDDTPRKAKNQGGEVNENGDDDDNNDDDDDDALEPEDPKRKYSEKKSLITDENDSEEEQDYDMNNTRLFLRNLSFTTTEEVNIPPLAISR